MSIAGLLLAIFHWVGLIISAEESGAYQNFLITLEMSVAAVLLWFAFPYRLYRDMRKDSEGRGVAIQNISSHFKDTLNPHDVVNDTIHNFSRVYQKYAIQNDLSEQDKDIGSDSDKSNDTNNSKESDTASPKGNTSIFSRKKSAKKDEKYERVILLVDSDEDEVL